MPVGATILDFGPDGSVHASVNVTGQSGLSPTSYIEAFVMMEPTSDNSEDAHLVAPMRLRGRYISATSFAIEAVSDWPLRDTYNVRWVTYL